MEENFDRRNRGENHCSIPKVEEPFNRKERSSNHTAPVMVRDNVVVSEEENNDGGEEGEPSGKEDNEPGLL